MKPDPSILLHPNIPKPLHGVNPRSIKGQAWWDVERRKCYHAADYCCEACGVHKSQALFHAWLEAHEFYDIDYKKGSVTFKRLVALCHACHNYIHSGRLQVLLKKGQISCEKYSTIIQHGDALTKDIKPTIQPSGLAPWGDWHLVFDGVIYKTPYASFAAWSNKYNPRLHSYSGSIGSELANSFDEEY